MFVWSTREPVTGPTCVSPSAVFGRDSWLQPEESGRAYCETEREIAAVALYRCYGQSSIGGVKSRFPVAWTSIDCVTLPSPE